MSIDRLQKEAIDQETMAQDLRKELLQYQSNALSQIEPGILSLIENDNDSL